MIKTDKGYARLYKIYGRTEGEVRDRLRPILKKGGAAVVYTRRRGKEIQVLAETDEQVEETAKTVTRPAAGEIKRALGDWYYSTKENETLEEAVVRLLMKYDLTVSTAESCTGGMIAARLVNVAGVSEVFREGYVTYSNKAKRKLLKVGKNTLKEFGAVSKQTAEEMARGGMEFSDSDVCIAVTGIAGPDGGTKEKPVGLVFGGCCVRGETEVEKWNFRGSRQEIREQSAMAALDLLRRMILKNFR